MNGDYILGAGPTGLGMGLVTGLPILERQSIPGGICSSYYVTRSGRLAADAHDLEDCYRFEHGGGHWLFGLDEQTEGLIGQFVELDFFERRASVYLPDRDVMLPYPIQHHGERLAAELRSAASVSTLSSNETPAQSGSLSEWLRARYGDCLAREFFLPFHQLYTAGLQEHVSPQDAYKSPTTQGPPGYNTRFAYPRQGLDRLFARLAQQCRVHYGCEVIRIEPRERRLHLANGETRTYRCLLSTIPLHRAVQYAGLTLEARADPCVSVHVLNLGASKGRHCPDSHWIYYPHSPPGFHRVGFYSNVSRLFLPRSVRTADSHVSVYVERCQYGGDEPSEEEKRSYAAHVVHYLQDLGYIGRVEAMNHSWIPTGYTWSWIRSTWKEEALQQLRDAGIHQLGRFGRWHFQGISESLAEGLRAGGGMRDDA